MVTRKHVHEEKFPVRRDRVFALLDTPSARRPSRIAGRPTPQFGHQKNMQQVLQQHLTDRPRDRFG